MKTSECSDMMPSVLKNCSCDMLVLPNTIKIAMTRLYAVTDSKEFRTLSILPCSAFIFTEDGKYTNIIAFTRSLNFLPHAWPFVKRQCHWRGCTL